MDFSRADVIYVFGMPDPLQHRIKSKCARECKAGARLISYVFPVAGWTPAIVDKPEDALPIYVYYRSEIPGINPKV